MSASPIDASAALKDSKQPAVGTVAGDFQLSNLQGKKIKLSDQLKNGPVVLLVLRGYPGYQCPLCTRQVSQFINSAPKFKVAKASVLLVYPGAVNNLNTKAGEFIQSQQLPANFHFLTDPGYKFTNAYGLRWDAKRETAYPSTFIIGTDGKVKYSKISKTHGNRSNAKEVLQKLTD
ncbi:MAG: peroxiredoxin family protein [Gimesia sp.]|nr:peroxiredoxin family protein [Gimesia sp.]